MAPDIFSNLDDLPAANIETIAERLEMRAGIDVFADMREQYFDAMALPADARILELGGGTGIVGRAYARRDGFAGQYVVSDLSQTLIDFGARKAAEDGLSERMEFRVVDALSGEGLDDGAYDAVIMHTIVSHLPDPEAALRVANAALKTGGIIAVFDADYGSMRIQSGNTELDETANNAFVEAAVAQPSVMRTLPIWASALGLKRFWVQSHFLAEVGDSDFFIGLAGALAGIVAAQGAMEQSQADDWLAALDDAIQRDCFFAMCPYFTYLYRKA